MPLHLYYKLCTYFSEKSLFYLEKCWQQQIYEEFGTTNLYTMQLYEEHRDVFPSNFQGYFPLLKVQSCKLHKKQIYDRFNTNNKH